MITFKIWRVQGLPLAASSGSFSEIKISKICFTELKKKIESQISGPIPIGFIDRFFKVCLIIYKLLNDSTPR